jgi:23S rRNA pseudouridine2605 synthase/16S rRNA pseudouridine516 synthase
MMVPAVSKMTAERLQKVMAKAGVASRRASEILIERGRVKVNGVVVTELGSRVDPAVDRIEVEGVPIQADTSMRYVMLNKPLGVVSTLSDEQGRPDLRQFTDRFEERLFNVGRLDAETTGLLLLTNDGEVANALAHPSFENQKTYIAKVKGEVGAAVIAKMRKGVELEDGQISADAVSLAGAPSNGESLLEITIHSGRNRIVRRFCESVGHPVIQLHRKSFGPLTLGSLASGSTRDLTKVEVGALLALVSDRRQGEA